MKNLSYSQTTIRSGFWKRYADLIRNTTIHAVYEQMAQYGRFAALRCDWKEGQPGKPHIFWDSDVAKWIEAVAYLTKIKREPELEAIVDEAAENIARNQKENGYFNSYYISVEGGQEFQDRSCHELYCAGHLIEAAIAYEEATGKDTLLNCMIRYADHIYQVFYIEDSAAFSTPGHEEIELALVQLYRKTGNQKYLTLAKHFIDLRGKHSSDSQNGKEQNADKDLLVLTKLNSRCSQDEMPVRKMTEAFGHAVRAEYLYCGMVDVAAETGDKELMEVAKRLYQNIVETKLSITGGVGACIQGEAFGFEYDLPNLTNYNETCAAIALSMLASRLQEQESNSRYADLIERILYNGALSGMSLDGKAFFYENALELDPVKFMHPYCDPDSMTAGDAHFRGLLAKRRIHRSEIFTCMCCPPNMCRYLASMTGLFYSVDRDTLYCHQFADSETTIPLGGKDICIEQKTDYPLSDTVTFVAHGGAVELRVRIPGWCSAYEGKTVNGYLPLILKDGEPATVTLPMEVQFIEANPKVHDCAGRCAVQYGPFIYCMESAENGEDLRDLELLENGTVKIELSETLHAPVLTIKAQRHKPFTDLYAKKSGERETVSVKLIPYFSFGNRQDGEMIVWTQVR